MHSLKEFLGTEGFSAHREGRYYKWIKIYQYVQNIWFTLGFKDRFVAKKSFGNSRSFLENMICGMICGCNNGKHMSEKFKKSVKLFSNIFEQNPGIISILKLLYDCLLLNTKFIANNIIDILLIIIYFLFLLHGSV